ncbi:MAG TPA: hypothetical protein VJ798_04505 [Rhizomicrobium sp.]|nr:hypothetical protein [Rhizomicrobium sp.]
MIAVIALVFGDLLMLVFSTQCTRLGRSGLVGDVLSSVAMDVIPWGIAISLLAISLKNKGIAADVGRLFALAGAYFSLEISVPFILTFTASAFGSLGSCPVSLLDGMQQEFFRETDILRLFVVLVLAGGVMIAGLVFGVTRAFKATTDYK